VSSAELAFEEWFSTNSIPYRHKETCGVAFAAGRASALAERDELQDALADLVMLHESWIDPMLDKARALLEEEKEPKDA
jgi:hypothetical protein